MSEKPSVLQDVPLELVDLSDTRLQMRVVTLVSDLMRSLETDGQDEPVELLGPAPYRIIDGFRRCQAARELGWKTIRAEVREGLSDEQAFRMAFTTNFVRKSLSSLDKANAMRLAMKMGIGKPELPKAIGLSGKQVQRYLEVGKLPNAVQAVIDDKVVTMAHALILAKFEVGNIDEVVALVRDQKLTAGDLRKCLERKLGKLAQSKTQGGKMRVFLRREGDALRFYSGRLRLDSSREALENVLAQILDAARVLQRAADERERKAPERLRVLEDVRASRRKREGGDQE